MGQIIFTLIFLVGTSFAKTYNLADLRALAEESSYREFLSHAMDIRPSERGEDWKTLVTRMALLQAQATMEQNPIPRREFLKVEELYRWPALAQNDDYRSRRMEIGLKYLRACTQRENPCWEDLRAFWKLDSSDPDMAVGLAELVRDRTDAPYPLWTFLESPLQTSLSEFYCRKPFVMKALWGKLGMDYLRLSKEEKFLSKIETTIHRDCLPALLDEARMRLISPTDTGDRELSFEILTSTGKADQGLRDFFYVIYLLENPSQGELMNLAWNNLSELGKSAERRDRVLDEIKKLDPLPDSIMGSLDLTKRRAILRHLKTTFPEFFDYYTVQCVSYYSGTLRFPKGNPTMKCQDLMNTEFVDELLPESRINEFRRVKKI